MLNFLFTDIACTDVDTPATYLTSASSLNLKAVQPNRELSFQLSIPNGAC